MLVDVLGLDEWKAGHLEKAIFLPVTSLRKFSLDPTKVAKTLPPKKEKKVLYTFCVVGMRAKQAAKILRELDYDVRPLPFGYDELVEAGFAKGTGGEPGQRVDEEKGK